MRFKYFYNQNLKLLHLPVGRYEDIYFLILEMWIIGNMGDN